MKALNIIKTILKSKAFYAGLTVILSAIGLSGPTEFMPKVEAMLCILVDGCS